MFELLILQGAQAGLSWATILRKRENYRHAFNAFDPLLMAQYDDEKVAALLADSGIVRNRAKVAASIQNAKACLVLTASGQWPVIQCFSVAIRRWCPDSKSMDLDGRGAGQDGTVG